MTKLLQLSHIPALLLVLALSLTSCVKPRPTPTPMPTKVGAQPTAAGAPLPTATLAATLEPTPEPTVEETPEVVETPTPAPTVPASGEISYEVRWGDTLSRIAREHSTTVDAIMARNPRLTNASQVIAGMVLVIPVGDTTSRPPAPAPGVASTYAVQAGDTLSSIARRFGTTVQALLDANPTLTDRNTVYAGQRLAIPGGTSSAPAEQRTHVVQAGDTLTAIARLYGTTIMAIVQRNNLPNQNAIFAGQLLIIP